LESRQCLQLFGRGRFGSPDQARANAPVAQERAEHHDGQTDGDETKGMGIEEPGEDDAAAEADQGSGNTSGEDDDDPGRSAPRELVPG
jgi:hypothetical protein